MKISTEFLLSHPEGQRSDSSCSGAYVMSAEVLSETFQWMKISQSSMCTDPDPNTSLGMG